MHCRSRTVCRLFKTTGCWSDRSGLHAHQHILPSSSCNHLRRRPTLPHRLQQLETAGCLDDFRIRWQLPGNRRHQRTGENPGHSAAPSPGTHATCHLPPHDGKQTRRRSNSLWLSAKHPTPNTLLTDIPYKQEDEVNPRRRKRRTQIQKRRLPHGSRLHINASVDYSAFSAFSSAAGAASSADTSSATGADSAAPAFLERRVRVAFFFVLAMFSS